MNSRICSVQLSQVKPSGKLDIEGLLSAERGIVHEHAVSQDGKLGRGIDRRAAALAGARVTGGSGGRSSRGLRAIAIAVVPPDGSRLVDGDGDRRSALVTENGAGRHRAPPPHGRRLLRTPATAFCALSAGGFCNTGGPGPPSPRK